MFSVDDPFGKVKKGGVNIWKNDISAEFPILSTVKNSNEAVCQIGFPHHGFKMVVELKNNELHGKAVITNLDGKVFAQFSYKNGNGNGKCQLYYESGSLFFSGYLINGYRDGLGIEYDESGDVMYNGFFTKGMRNYRILKNKEKEGYWNEICERATVLSICHKDKHGRNDGVCYFYKNSVIDHISRWEKGIEVELLHLFHGDIMESYKNGKLVYYGPFQQISDMEIRPKDDAVNNNDNNNNGSEEDSSLSTKLRRKKKGNKKKKPGKMKLDGLEITSTFFHILAVFTLVLSIVFYYLNMSNENKFVKRSLIISFTLFLIAGFGSTTFDCIICTKHCRRRNEIVS